jgi:hypothetical protein
VLERASYNTWKGKIWIDAVFEHPLTGKEWVRVTWRDTNEATEYPSDCLQKKKCKHVVENFKKGMKHKTAKAASGAGHRYNLRGLKGI